MNYTFPVNKQDILLNAGFSILWQCMDLEDDSKIVKDNQKSLTMLSSKISKENTSANSEFHKVASSFVSIGNSPSLQPKNIGIDTSAARLLSPMPAPQGRKQKTAKKQLQAIAARFSSFSTKDKLDEQHKRRVLESEAGATPKATPYPRTNSSISLVSTQSAPVLHSSTPSPRTTTVTKPNATAASVVNLDYFPFDCGFQAQPSQSSSTTMLPPKKRSSPSSNSASWEHLIPDPDLLTGNLYGPVEPNEPNKCVSNPETLDWTGDMWPLGGFNMSPRAHVPQSLLSFSEESLTSVDDFVFSTAGSHHGSMSTQDSAELPTDKTFKGITMPVSSIEDDLDFNNEIKA